MKRKHLERDNSEHEQSLKGQFGKEDLNTDNSEKKKENKENTEKEHVSKGQF